MVNNSENQQNYANAEDYADEQNVSTNIQINNISQAFIIITNIISKFDSNNISNIMTQLNLKYDQNFLHAINDIDTSKDLITDILNNFNDNDNSNIISHLIENSITSSREKSRAIIHTLQTMQDEGTNLITHLYKEIEKQKQNNTNEDSDIDENDQPETKKCKKAYTEINDIEMSTPDVNENQLQINNTYDFPHPPKKKYHNSTQPIKRQQQKTQKMLHKRTPALPTCKKNQPTNLAPITKKQKKKKRRDKRLQLPPSLYQ